MSLFQELQVGMTLNYSLQIHIMVINTIQKTLYIRKSSTTYVKVTSIININYFYKYIIIFTYIYLNMTNLNFLYVLLNHKNMSYTSLNRITPEKNT
jgi:hypothetical protein